jgi:hypothetical protein
MALIKCSECENEVWNKAGACPRCGAPTKLADTPTQPPTAAATTSMPVSSIPVPTPAAERANNSPYRPWIISAAVLGSFVVGVGITVNAGLAIVVLLVGGAGFYVAMRAKIEMARRDIPAASKPRADRSGRQPNAPSRPRRSAVVTVAALGVISAMTFWLTFGTLDPCAAMKAQIASIGESQAGILGSAVVDLGELLARPKMEALSPVECAASAIKLKVGGADALSRMVGNSIDPQ